MTTEPPAPRLVVPEELHPQGLKDFDPSRPVVDFGGPTMGTTWQVRLALRESRTVAALKTAIQHRLNGIVAQMSHWDESSLLSQFNRAQPGSWTMLPGDFARVMACAFDIAERSGGAFDPAQGRLTDIWGLGPNKIEGQPGEAARRQALDHSGWRRLALDTEAHRLRQPGGVWLDLSGIAKAFAADAVAELLADHDCYHALVEVGGECVGRGIRPDGDPWWVEVENPPQAPLAPLRIALHQLAVATSGDYLRGAHTLDPRTGLPAIYEACAVSVIHESCMAADAWATALSAVRFGEARELAEAQDLAARIVLRDGGEWLSPALQRLL